MNANMQVYSEYQEIRLEPNSYSAPTTAFSDLQSC